MPDAPTLWKFLPRDDVGALPRSWFEYPLPTEVVLRPRRPAYGPQHGYPRMGRIYRTEWRVRPDGTVEDWRAHNDGLGHPVCLQEVFEDLGDDGHVDYLLTGYRYVPFGTDPWAEGQNGHGDTKP